MGGGNLGPEVSEVQVNPTIQIKTSLGANPEILTREDLSTSVTDAGFTLDDITYLVQFGEGVNRIGSNFVSDLNIDICSTYATDGKLTSIFRGPDDLIDICYSAFMGMSLNGGLDFSGFTSLEKIGAEAFMDNSLNDRVTFSAVDSLLSVEHSAFKNAGISGPLEINGLSNLVDIKAEAFANNKITSVTLKDLNSLERIGSGSTGGKVFYGNEIDTITLDNLSSLNEICGEEIFGNNPLRGSFRLKNISLVNTRATGGICYENFQDDLEFDNVTGGTGGNIQLPPLADLSFTGDLIIKNTDISAIDLGTFYNTKFSKLTLTGNNDLSFIGAEAFSNANFERGIQISDNSNLSSIGTNAFYQSNIKQDASGLILSLPSLKTIEDGAFAAPDSILSQSLGKLTFETPLLQSIGSSNDIVGVFQYAGVSGELDLSELTNLNTIGDNAFANNSITEVKLPVGTSSLVLHPQAFANNNISGYVDFSGIKDGSFEMEVFAGNDNILGYTFFESSGFYIAAMADVRMGDVSGWDQTGFYISSNELQTYTIPPINRNIIFGYNPNIPFTDPLYDFPVFTKESFTRWTEDVSNFLLPGFTDLSLNRLVRFDGLYESIGPAVLKDLSNIEISGSLTDILPLSIIDISDSAFENFGISGDLNFNSNYFNLKNIGNKAFFNNPNLESLTFDQTSYLNNIGPNAFKEKAPRGSLAFKYIFGEFNSESSSFTTSKLKDAFDYGEFDGSLEIVNVTAFTEIGDFSNASFKGRLFLDSNSANILPQAFQDSSFSSLVVTNNNNMVSIGESAFEGINNLQEITIQENYDLSVINHQAFKNSFKPSDSEHPAGYLSLDLTSNQNLETIGDEAFFQNESNKALGELNITNLQNLKTIGKSAFQYSNISGGLDFSGLTSLTTINDLAFATAISGDDSSLDFSSNNALQRIGKSAFITTGTSHGFTDINFTNCISLQTIDASAFSTESTLPKTKPLNLSGLTSLETINAEAFSGNKFKGLVVEGCPDLSNIGNDAFKNIGICGGDLIFRSVPKLTSFPTNAFDSISISEGFDGSLVLTETGFTELGGFSNIFRTGFFGGSLQINGNTDLSIINQSAFNGIGFSSFELKNNDNLKYIDVSAFGLNSFDGVNLTDLSNLIHIREKAFKSSIVDGPIVLSNLPKLSAISNECFADNDCKYTLTIENCPSLQILDSFSFYGSGISGDVTISGLDSLESIQDNAFGTTIPAYATRIKSVKFVNCPNLKGDSNNFGSFCNNYPFGTGDLELNNLPSFDDPLLENLKNQLALAPTPPIPPPPSSDFTGSLTLKKLPLVTSIQDFSGFASKFEGSLIINDCCALFNIGGSAFKDCSFISLELTDNSALASIDDHAFQGNKFSKIDLKNNTNLTTIGIESFADISNPNGTSLDLTGLTSLETIGEKAFFESNISGELDFTGLSSLIDICSSAFEGFVTLPSGYDELNVSVTFGDNSNLVTIGESAFHWARITPRLNLSGLTSLKTIGQSAFDGQVLNEGLHFGNTPSLETIEQTAFQNAGISGEINFSETNIQNIGDYAFNNVDSSGTSFENKITSFSFKDNSGCQLGQSVYTDLSGVDSSCSIPSLSILWLDAGFSITNSAEHVWYVPS